MENPIISHHFSTQPSYAFPTEQKLKQPPSYQHLFVEKATMSQVKIIAHKWNEIYKDAEALASSLNLSSAKVVHLIAQLNLGASISAEIAENDESEEGKEGYVAYNIDGHPQGIATTLPSDKRSDAYLEWILVAPWNIKDLTFLTLDQKLPQAVSRVGTQMIQEIIRQSIVKSGKASLEVNSADLALPFYKKLGFKLMGDKDWPNFIRLTHKLGLKLLQKNTQ